MNSPTRNNKEKLDQFRENLQIGIEQLARGEFRTISSPAEQTAFQEELKARGRERRLHQY